MATPACILQDAQWSSITPRSTVTLWHRRVLGSVLRLKLLPESWDTYGSPRLQNAAQESATELIALLSKSDPPLPNVSPVPGGGVQFEWEINRRALEIEVLPDGSIEFLAIAEDGATAEGTLDQIYGHAPRLIRWLTSSNAAVWR
jgi:hypothetical protein